MLRDFLHGARMLRRSPLFSLAAVAVLALAIGANTAIFSVLHAVLLRPLPYREAGRLVMVWARIPGMPDPPGNRINSRRKDFQSWQRENSVFSGMAALRQISLNETRIEKPERLRVIAASAPLLPLLGVEPQLGRVFGAEEDRSGNDLAVMLSDQLWEKRFGRDKGCIGKTMTLDGSAYSVIGVLPRDFRLPNTYEGLEQLDVDAMVPVSRLWRGPAEDDDKRMELMVAARLKPGVTLERARAEMNALTKRAREADPKNLPFDWSASVFPFEVEDRAPKVQAGLVALMGAVAFVLLIACANLANFMLARAAGRTREIAVRFALGAGRWALVRQMLAESMLLAVAGGAAGILVAEWGIAALTALAPADLLHHPEMVRLNPVVLVFAAVLTLATGLLFGIAPALRATATDVQQGLKAAGGWGGSRSRGAGHSVLVAAEVALALMLASGAGLLIRSFQLVMGADLGFARDRVLLADVDLPAARYPDAAAQARFERRLLERLESLPGVERAALTDNVPLHRISVANYEPEGVKIEKDQEPMADYANVTPGLFSALGIQLKLGREFTEADVALNAKREGGVVIVNETLARQQWPGQNPVGKHVFVKPENKEKKPWRVIGVVGELKQMGAENDSRPQLFWPAMGYPTMVIVLRTRADGARMQPLIEREVHALDADLPVHDVNTMSHMLEEFIGPRRFMTLLIGMFAGIAVLLAAIGIYAVLAQNTAARTREIGIRMALGARAGDVLGMILRQSLRPVGAGVAAGVAVTLALGRYLESLLFGVEARDPAVLATLTALVLGVATAASYLPARRAARMDPNVALREE